MSLTHRITAVSTAPLSGRTLDARLRLVPRAAAGLVALAFTMVAAGQLLSGRRVADLQQTSYPVLRDSRALGVTLDAVRSQLAAAPSDPRALERADSLADRFHAIAHATVATSIVEADRRFSDYYMVARAAASTGAETPTGREAARQAAASVAELSGQLAQDTAAATQALDDAMASTAATQSLVTRSVLVVGVMMLAALALLGAAASASVGQSMDQITDAVDAVAAGRLPLIAERETGAAGRLQDALRRLARRSEDNAALARSLASGAYREALHGYPATDPTGQALARIAANMDGHASAANRIARGDLRASVVPQSEDDTFGQAQAAMLRRITDSLTELDATRAGIESAIDALRVDASALAASAGEDADRLRRTIDRLAAITVQARRQADRGAALVQRAAATDAMVRRGADEYQEAHQELKAAVDRSGTVQQLARSAAVLAVRARDAEGGSQPLDDEIRALVRESAATSRVVTRSMIDGSERAYESAVAIDQVALAVRESASLVREVSVASHRQAQELTALDDAIVELHGSATQRADHARGLVLRADQLAQQARRLDTAIRRFRRPGSPRLATTDAVLTGPTLYRTPTRHPVVLPMMAMASR
jgi:DNA-binding transcriptional MerR regulator